jgi:hypothetical protein
VEENGLGATVSEGKGELAAKGKGETATDDEDFLELL